MSVASLDHHNCVRNFIFAPDDILTLKESTFQRRQGRPRLSWANEVFKAALQTSGNIPNLLSLLDTFNDSPREWLATIDSYLYSTNSID